MKKILSAIMTGLALVVLSGCTVSNPFGSKSPDRTCVTKVIASYKNYQASGVWACMTLRMRAAEFDSNGWQSDKDVTNWLQNIKAEGLFVQAVEFNQDPVQVQDNSGNTFYEYHYRLIPTSDPTAVQDPTSLFAFSLVITINSSGQIVSLA